MQLLKTRSGLVTCFLALLIVTCFYKNPRQKNGYFRGELQWDVFSYYMYLPFTFIYDDPGMQRRDVVDDIFKKYNLPGTYYQAYQLDNGNWTPNYTMGFALLWSPFFFIGHTWAKLGGYPVDGWSLPYQFSIATGALVYILLGLFFLRKLLLRFFSDGMTALLMVLVVLGTNYFHETFNDYLQPHAVIAAGYAILLYCIVRWHEKPERKYVMGAGLVMGFMILARPSEILCIMLPLLWNVYDRPSFQAKIRLLKEHRSHILLLLAFAFIPFIPQIAYWKYITGHWIFYSYQHTEGFDFLQPHVFNVLFSFKKSLLVYTPILIFPFIGLFSLRKYNRPVFLPIALFALVNFYLLSSWAAWWNGGSYGMRYFVDSYPVMAIPFGYFLAALKRRSLLLKVPVALLTTFFVVLNLFQTWQYVYAIIPEDRMTWEYYKRIFFKAKVTDDDRGYMAIQRSYESTEKFENPQDYNMRLLAYFDYDTLNSAIIDPAFIDTTQHRSGSHALHYGPDNEFGPKYTVQYDDVVPSDRDHAWLKISLYYFSEGDIKDNPTSLVINMPHFRYNLKYRGIDFEKLPYENGKWNHVEFEYMTPFPYSESDHFEVYIWHRGKKNLWIDDMRIDAFLKK